jgi:hypothetical protein
MVETSGHDGASSHLRLDESFRRELLESRDHGVAREIQALGKGARGREPRAFSELAGENALPEPAVELAMQCAAAIAISGYELLTDGRDW